MDKKVAITDLPLEVLLQVAKEAGQKAGREAIATGRSVAGWKDGKLIEFSITDGHLSVTGETSRYPMESLKCEPKTVPSCHNPNEKHID